MKILIKTIILGFLCLSCVACSSNQAPKETQTSGSVIGINCENPTISYCKTRYLSTPETRTIPEIFTGEEYTYTQLTLRTQPNKRAGMYFFIMMDYGADEISLASTIEISLDSNDCSKVRTFTFRVPQTHSVLREMRLGITGSDWKNPKAVVNAWKIVIKSPSGKILCQKQSWLWAIKGSDRENVKK